jgi:hypothetical protein
MSIPGNPTPPTPGQSGKVFGALALLILFGLCAYAFARYPFVTAFGYILVWEFVAIAALFVLRILVSSILIVGVIAATLGWALIVAVMIIAWPIRVLLARATNREVPQFSLPDFPSSTR